jgi:hypothetical protein
MSKITVALGSFTLGAVCSFLLFGSQTLTLAQSSAPQAPSPVPPATRCVIDGLTAKGVGGKVFEFGTEPKVLGFGPAVCRATIEDSTQSLDGLNCTDCVFTNATLEYSGGAYNFVRTSFIGTTRVVLKGPAANTVATLPLLEAIAAGSAEPPPNPNRPILKSATAKTPVRIDWRSPYSGQ